MNLSMNNINDNNESKNLDKIDAVIAIIKKEGITSADLVKLVKLKLRELGIKKKVKVGH